MTNYSGREFSPQEIEQIRQLMQQCPTLLRTPLSRKLCELFAWTKPTGELKRVHVGRTTGRGKKSAVHHQIIPIKDIWLYPLQTDFAAVLCR